MNEHHCECGLIVSPRIFIECAGPKCDSNGCTQCFVLDHEYLEYFCNEDCHWNWLEDTRATLASKLNDMQITHRRLQEDVSNEIAELQIKLRKGAK